MGGYLFSYLMPRLRLRQIIYFQTHDLDLIQRIIIIILLTATHLLVPPHFPLAKDTKDTKLAYFQHGPSVLLPVDSFILLYDSYKIPPLIG